MVQVPTIFLVTMDSNWVRETKWQSTPSISPSSFGLLVSKKKGNSFKFLIIYSIYSERTVSRDLFFNFYKTNSPGISRQNYFQIRLQLCGNMRISRNLDLINDTLESRSWESIISPACLEILKSFCKELYAFHSINQLFQSSRRYQ